MQLDIRHKSHLSTEGRDLRQQYINSQTASRGRSGCKKPVAGKKR